MAPSSSPSAPSQSPKLPRLPVLRRERSVLASIHGSAMAMDLPHPWAYVDRKLPPISKSANLESLRQQARKLPARKVLPSLPKSQKELHLSPSETAVWRTDVLSTNVRTARSGQVSLPPLLDAKLVASTPNLHRTASQVTISEPSMKHTATGGGTTSGPTSPVGPTSPSLAASASERRRKRSMRTESQNMESPPHRRRSGASRSSRCGGGGAPSPLANRSFEDLMSPDGSPGPKTPGGLPPLDPEQVERVFGRLKEPLGADMLCEHLPIALKQIGFHDLDQSWIDEIKESVVGQGSFCEKPEFVEVVEKYRERHIERLSGEFATFDLNGNGEIDAVELAAMLENLGITVIPGIVRELLQEITGRHNANRATLNAYLRLREIISHRGGFTVEEVDHLRDLFERYDDNGNGHMDLEELESALKWLGMSLHHGSIRRSSVVPGGQKILAAPQLDKLVEGIEYDEQKGLGFEHFLLVMRRHREMEIAWSRNLIKEYAKSESSITWEEAIEVVHTLGYITVSVNVLKECAEDIGTSADVDAIAFNDFYMIFRRVRSREGFLRTELDEFQAAFSLHDTDGSGAVDVVELGGALRWMGYPVTVEEQKLLMDDVDVDKSGELDYDEFLKVMRWYKEEELKRVKKAFDDGDHKHRGMLERDQVIFFLCGLGPHIATDKTVTTMVKEVCGDKTDITFEEVLLMVESLHKQCHIAFREKHGFHGEELHNLQELFAKHDRAGNGEITRQDISRLFLELFPDAASQEGRETAAAILQKVDADGDGKLEFLEFLHLMRLVQDRKEHSSVLHEQKVAASCGFTRSEVADLRKVFKLCDTDGSKSVEADEMIDMLSTMGALSGEKRSRVRHIFKEVDEDDTESLNFAQFLTVMRRVYDEGLVPQL